MQNNFNFNRNMCLNIIYNFIKKELFKDKLFKKGILLNIKEYYK